MTIPPGYEAITAGVGAWTTDHLGQFEVSGPDAGAFVNRITTADLSKLPSGRFAHALMLRDDASILARVTVYRLHDVVMLLVDGAVKSTVWNYLVTHKRGTVRLRDISDDVAVLAVRGPDTLPLLSMHLMPMPATHGDLTHARLDGIDCFAGRTTADGPVGLDLYCRRRDLPALAEALERLGVISISNDAWEITRLECGTVRIGHEIADDDTPIEAGLDHLVATNKGTRFPGDVAFDERTRVGPLRRLVGFSVPRGTAPPLGAEVHAKGRLVDRVRSVGRSPRVGVIGMTAVPLGADAPGTPISIMSDGERWDAMVVEMPFVSETPETPRPGRWVE